MLSTTHYPTSPRLWPANECRPLEISKSSLNYSLCYIRYNYLILFIILLMPSHLVQTLQLPVQQQQQQDDPEVACLNCIRSVTSVGIEPNKRCEGGYYCGPFQFSYQYWAESGKLGNSQGIRDFEKCARDKQCAEQTVKAYFKKFKRDCNNDGLIDCLDMAALHKAGPSGCSSDWFFKSKYWSTFNKTTCTLKRDPANSIPISNKSELFGNQANSQRQVVIKNNQTLTTECLDCICEALSSCSSTSASNCGSGLVCGPFAISQAYWKDGRRPGASWTACARTKECSSLTIKNYMDKYKRDCNGDGYVTCEDYAAIHRRGPMSCTNRDLLKEQYWMRFLTCRSNQRPSNDANLVKVNEDNNQETTFNQGNRIGDSSSSPALTTQSVQSNSISQISSNFSASIASSTVTTAKLITTAAITSTTSIPIATLNPTTKFRPSYHETNEHQKEPMRPTSGSLEQNPTYELNPVVLETKATSNQVRTYQTAKPTQNQAYESVEHSFALAGHEISAQDQYQDANTNGLSQTKSSPTTLTPSTEYYRPQLTQTVTYQEPNPRRPFMDYSSLPTIIVSKRMEPSDSTSRISQPPPAPVSSAVFIEESSAVPMATTSMTTLSPAQSLRTTFPYNIQTATTLGAIIETASSQQQGAHFVPASLSNDQVNDQTMDYTLSDFPGNSGGVDRVSFDRVVNGIVANSDFSKTYPPLLENIVQRKQPVSSNSPRGPNKDVGMQTTKTAAEGQSSVAQASKRENSKTLSPNIYNTLDGSEQQARPDIDHSNLSSLFGPNALNMTNLFDKGLNESSKIASECLDCICDASSNCDATVQCISKQREKNRCGLYMISWNQYKESDISLTALLPSQPSSPSAQNDDGDERLYYECTTDKNCAEKLIHLYIEKYQKDCNLDGKIDCYDIAAIHRVGPDICNSNKFLSSQYWRDFNHCYATDRLTTTLQPSLPASQGG